MPAATVEDRFGLPMNTGQASQESGTANLWRYYIIRNHGEMFPGAAMIIQTELGSSGGERIKASARLQQSGVSHIVGGDLGRFYQPLHQTRAML
jgi:hypothetical protein